MKNSDKQLPHLNQLFLQRQSYKFHKRKMWEIKTKKVRPSFQNDLYLHTRRPSLRESKVTSNDKRYE